jgi:hypothetical protein
MAKSQPGKNATISYACPAMGPKSKRTLSIVLIRLYGFALFELAVLHVRVEAGKGAYGIRLTACGKE